MSRAKLTRRQRRLYEDVLVGEETRHYYAHPCAGSWQYGAGLEEVGIGWQAALFAAEFAGRKDVDLRRLEALVLKSRDPRCAYFFARHVPGADVAALLKLVESSGDKVVLSAFLKHVANARKA